MPHTHHRPTPREARRGVLIHGLAYLAVNTGLIALNLRSGEHYWFQWPLLGWGAGLAWHAGFVASRVGPIDHSTRRKAVAGSAVQRR